MKLFLSQLYFELWKLFARKRTYLGFVAFLAMEILVLLFLRLPKVAHAFERATSRFGLDFSHYFSGLTLAHIVVTATIFLLGSLYLALVCGDMVAKEVEDGTMRMVLSRPISRLRVLLLKYAACVIYTWTLTIFIVGSSLLLGIANKGVGGMFVMMPLEHIFGFFEAGPAFQRFGIGTCILLFVMLTPSTIAFMFSCFNMKPATATIATLSVFFIDYVFDRMPNFESIHGYFLSHNMGMWGQCFQQQMPWGEIVYSVLYLMGFNLLLFSLGAAYFFRRDFKS